MAAIVGFHGNATPFVGVPSEIARAQIPDTAEVLANLSNVLGPNHDPVSRWAATPSALVTADSSFTKQVWWADQVAEARKAHLPTLGTARDHVRLVNQEGPFASAWLSAIPNRALNNTLTTPISGACAGSGWGSLFCRRAKSSQAALSATRPWIPSGITLSLAERTAVHRGTTPSETRGAMSSHQPTSGTSRRSQPPPVTGQQTCSLWGGTRALTCAWTSP